MTMYRVVVGNVGTVYEGRSELRGHTTFAKYREQSQWGFGRSADENVTLFADGEIIREYVPDDYATYLVACKDDENGLYVLATRRTFTRQEAKAYIATISRSRKPIMIGALNPFEIVRK